MPTSSGLCAIFSVRSHGTNGQDRGLMWQKSGRQRIPRASGYLARSIHGPFLSTLPDNEALLGALVSCDASDRNPRKTIAPRCPGGAVGILRGSGSRHFASRAVGHLPSRCPPFLTDTYAALRGSPRLATGGVLGGALSSISI